MRKSERGSATLLVFTTVMFMLIALSTILTSVYFKNKSQLTEMDKLRDAYTTDDMEDAFKEKMGVSADTYVETKSGLTQITYKAENGEEKTVDITAKNASKYYGWKVTNYNPTDDTTGTYRIFYYDAVGKYGEKNTVYLKRDYTDNEVYIDNEIKNSNWTISNKNKALNIMKKMNPLWTKNQSSIGEYSDSLITNVKESIWLCDSTLFTNYVDTKLANYSIGCSGLEMYCDSYNEVEHLEGKTGKDAFTYEYQTNRTPGYAFLENGIKSGNGWMTSENSIDKTGYHGMYFFSEGTKGKYYWWLASPSSCDKTFVCSINGYYARLGDYYTGYGICPLVSLKTGVELQIVDED